MRVGVCSWRVQIPKAEIRKQNTASYKKTGAEAKKSARRNVNIKLKNFLISAHELFYSAAALIEKLPTINLTKTNKQLREANSTYMAVLNSF